MWKAVNTEYYGLLQVIQAARILTVEMSYLSITRNILESESELPPICQINFELHYPPKDFGGSIAEFFDAFLKIIDSGRYLPIHLEEYKDTGFFRIFFVNVREYTCVRKYLCSDRLPVFTNFP